MVEEARIRGWLERFEVETCETPIVHLSIRLFQASNARYIDTLWFRRLVLREGIRDALYKRT